MSHTFPLDYHLHEYTPLTAVLAARSAATERFDNSTEPPLVEQHTLLANMLVALLDAGADAGFACPGIDAIMLRDLHALELLLGRMSRDALADCLRGVSEGGSSRAVGRSGGMLHVAGFSPSVGFARLFFRMRRLAQRGEWADAPDHAAATARAGRRGGRHAPADALAALQEHLGLHDTAAIWDEEHEEAGRQGIDDSLGAAEADALIVHGALLGVDVADPVYLEGLNGDGLTPLLMACMYGRAPVVAVLLELGANPWAAAARRFNFSCGHLAASRGYSGVLAVLRAHSPEAAAALQHATDSFGRTAAAVADAMRAVGQAEGVAAAASGLEPVSNPRATAAGASGKRHAAKGQTADRFCSCPGTGARAGVGDGGGGGVGVASDALRGFNPAAHVAAGWRLARPSDLPALLLPEDFWWRQTVRVAEAHLQRDDESADDGSGVRDAGMVIEAPCSCATGGATGANPALAQRAEQQRRQHEVPRLGRQPDVIAADTAFPVPLLSEATVLAQHPPPAFIRDVVSLERPYVVQLTRLPADIVPRLPGCSRDRLDAAARANGSSNSAGAALLPECTPHASAARFGAALAVDAAPAAPDSPGAGFAASYLSRRQLVDIMGLLRVAEGLTPYSSSYGFGGSNVPLHSFVRAAMGTHAAAAAAGDGKEEGSTTIVSLPSSAESADEPIAESWLQRVQESLLRSWEVIGADAGVDFGPDGRARRASLGRLLPETRFNLSALLVGARAAPDNSPRRNADRDSGHHPSSPYDSAAALSSAPAHSHTALSANFGFSGPGVSSSAEGRDGAVSASPIFPHYIFDGILLNTDRYTPLFDALTASIPSALLAPRNHHRQLIVGPPLSGAMPHFHNPALNLLLVGVKLWVLLPPGNATFGQSHARYWFEDTYRRKYAGLPAEGLAVDAVEAAAAALLADDGEQQSRQERRGVNWIDTGDGRGPGAPEAGHEGLEDRSSGLHGIAGARWSFSPQPVPHYRFLQEAGDLVFVPEHWGHAVINLSDTVAVAIE